MNVILREFKLFKRSGAWFMFILTPLIIVFCISLAISGSVHNIPVGVASNNPQESQNLVKALNSDGGRISAKIVAFNAVDNSFVSGNLKSVIFIQDNATGFHKVSIYIDSTDQSLKEQMNSYLSNLLYQYYQPGTFSITIINEYSNYSFMDYYAATIIMIAALMSGIFIASDSILKERETKTIENVIVTGFNPIRFTTEKIISFASLQTISTIAIYFLLVLIGLPLGDLEQVFAIIITITVIQLIFVSLGFIMSSFVPNSEIAGAVGGTIMFPLMFISGAFYSVYSMSPLIIPLAKVNPVTIGQVVLTTLILKSGTFATILPNLLILIGYGMLFFIVANILIYRLTNSIRA